MFLKQSVTQHSQFQCVISDEVLNNSTVLRVENICTVVKLIVKIRSLNSVITRFTGSDFYCLL